jgi:hypothetical protein
MRRFEAIAAAGLALSAPAMARTAGDPIVLDWSEGDVAGMSTIYAADGQEPIGVVQYHQTRRGDVLTAVRVARFRDGSSDEDVAAARVDGRLEALHGRSLVRDAAGRPVVDIRIDVARDRVTASWQDDGRPRSMDERWALPPGTYWGPLVFLVLKNFAANAEAGRVVFRTVAPAPRPLLLDMELVRTDAGTVERTGVPFAAERYELRPTVHRLVDPLVRLLAPRASFWVQVGTPPALVRFDGPRNFGRQPIRIQ